MVPNQSVSRRPTREASAPPVKEPSGITPHTMKRLVAFRRPNMRSGVTACWKEMPVTLKMMPPKVPRRSAATKNGIGCDWGAAGTRSRDGAKSSAEPTSVGRLEPCRNSARSDSAREPAEVSDGEDDADGERRQLQLANGVDEKDREGEGAEEVRDCHCDGNRPPQTVADEVAQAFHELAAHAWRLSRLRDDLGPSDSKHEHRRAYEADGVEQDRVRRGDRADECARQPRPRELCGRAADLELRVAFDEASARPARAGTTGTRRRRTPCRRRRRTSTA